MNADIRILRTIPPRSYPKPQDFSDQLAAYNSEANTLGDEWMPVLVTLGAVTQGSGVFVRRSDRPTKQTMRDAWTAVSSIWPDASKVQCLPTAATTVQFLPKSDTYNVFFGGEWVYSHDRNGPCTDRVALADSID